MQLGTVHLSQVPQGFITQAPKGFPFKWPWILYSNQCSVITLILALCLYGDKMWREGTQTPLFKLWHKKWNNKRIFWHTNSSIAVLTMKPPLYFLFLFSTNWGWNKIYASFYVLTTLRSVPTLKLILHLPEGDMLWLTGYLLDTPTVGDHHQKYSVLLSSGPREPVASFSWVQFLLRFKQN